METLVILNPRSGNADELSRVRHLLRRLPDLEIRETEHPGHARELAARAAEEGCRLVVSAGGDGTVNEVVNGLSRDFSCSRLGVLPLGTGNDFARSIGVPGNDLEAAVELLLAGDSRKLDVARARFGDAVHHFLNMSVGGFSTKVDRELDAETKQRWGSLSYARSAVEALPELTPYRTRLRLVDAQGDAEELDLSLYVLVVANGRYVAGGIPAAPESRLDDGLLDVVAFPEMPASRIAALIPPTLLGRHVDHELVTVRRARRLEVEASPPMPFNVDGEPCGETPVELSVEPRALEVVVGPEPPSDDVERARRNGA